MNELNTSRPTHASYEFIIAGSGAAGLSLALALTDTKFQHSNILIIDRDHKTSNDRTWCFWSPKPSPYPSATFRTWNKLAFVSEDFSTVYNLGKYNYYMIRGIDFYNYARKRLAERPNITFLQGNIEIIRDNDHHAEILVDGKLYSGKYIFNSLFEATNDRIYPEKYHYLMQHFKGWEIQTTKEFFTPDTPTMFDFRTPQKGVMRFMYTLPFTSTKALIEYTLFSPHLLSPEEYEFSLKEYIKNTLNIDSYEIIAVENGVIPMTDRPFPRRHGKHILNIGTAGGRVKPSTGYAFHRIQKDSLAIAQSLQQYGHPFKIPPDSRRYRWFDRVMLQVMYRNGNEMKTIFTHLFKNNSIGRLFRFLDEEGNLLENIGLLNSVPRIHFLRAWYNLSVRRKL